MVVAPESLSKLNAEQLRAVVNELLQTVTNKDADLARRDAEITFKQAVKRAAAVMSLIQSAKLNGHDPYAYLKDVLSRLPTQRASQVGQLLPHRWLAQT